MRGHRPSPALIVAFLALVVALGGTALAATGQLVNITDPGTSSHKAKVDSSGALKTAVATADSAFYGSTFLSTAGKTLIGPTTSTLAITRFVLANDQPGSPIVSSLIYVPGDSTSCNNAAGSRNVVRYNVPALDSVSDAMPTPLILRPARPATVWCLEASLGFFGTASNAPELSWTGYVISGAAPANARASAPPRIHHRGH